MAYGASDSMDSEMMTDGPMPKGEMEDSGEPQGVLPLSLMAGKDFKPGDEIVLKITRVGDKDFSVEYAPPKDQEEGEGEEMPEEKPDNSGRSEMSSLMY